MFISLYHVHGPGCLLRESLSKKARYLLVVVLLYGAGVLQVRM